MMPSRVAFVYQRTAVAAFTEFCNVTAHVAGGKCRHRCAQATGQPLIRFGISGVAMPAVLNALPRYVRNINPSA